MRQSPDDQIVHIESELREETLHSSTVREAPGMSKAPHHLRHCIHHCPQPRPCPPHVEPSFCPFRRMDYLRHRHSSSWTASSHLPLTPPHLYHYCLYHRLAHRHDHDHRHQNCSTRDGRQSSWPIRYLCIWTNHLVVVA